MERRRLLNAGEKGEPNVVEAALADAGGVFVAASDYMKALPSSIARWVPGPLAVLGTDGFGLSEDRAVLRDHFEVSADWIVFAALSTLAREGRRPRTMALEFAENRGLDLSKPDPAGF